MSFGVFSAKYGSEPKIDLDMAIEEDIPFTFSEQPTQEQIESAELPESAQPTITYQEPPVEIPWSLVVPAAVLGVVGVGLAWYFFKDKPIDIPV